MSLTLSLCCSGPPGPNNGCPEGHRTFVASSAYGRDDMIGVFNELAAQAEAIGWRRGRDNLFRCVECAKSAPPAIAGIAYAKWLEALDRFCAGEPPSVWGGTDGLPTAKQFNNVIHGGRYPELRKRWMEGPTFKADRKKRSTSLPEARWTEVLRRFLAGEDKIDICTDEELVWPSVSMWNARMEKNAAFRDAVNAEHERRRAVRAAQIDWPRALTRFGLGETLESLSGDADMPTRNEWSRRVANDPAFRAEVINARPYSAGASRLLLGSGKFDRVEALMGEGLTLEDAVARARIEPAPTKKKYRRDFAFNADHVAKRLGCSRDSAAQKLYRYGVPKGEDSDVYGWDDEAEFEAVIDLLSKPKPQRAAVLKKFKPAVQSEEHHKSLAANPLYAAADKAVPRNLPPHMRADVISQMVLDVLEGWLDLDNLATFARDYVRKHDRETERWKLKSLDATVPGTDDLRLIDTLDSEVERF